MSPNGCDSNLAIAQQFSINSTLSNASSSLSSLTTASTFPELLNSGALIAFEESTQISSTTVQPFFASGAAEDQLSSATPLFTTGDAILDAAVMFATSTLSQTLKSNLSRSGLLHFASFASILPMSTQSLLAPETALPESHGLSQNDSMSGSDMTPAFATSPAMLRPLRSSVAAITTPWYGSQPGSGYTVSFISNRVASSSTDEKSRESKMSSQKLTSKRTSYTSRHAIHTSHTSASKTDDKKTTTYTSTVTRLVTITVPACCGGSDTNSY